MQKHCIQFRWGKGEDGEGVVLFPMQVQWFPPPPLPNEHFLVQQHRQQSERTRTKHSNHSHNGEGEKTTILFTSLETLHWQWSTCQGQIMCNCKGGALHLWRAPQCVGSQTGSVSRKEDGSEERRNDGRNGREEKVRKRWKLSQTLKWLSKFHRTWFKVEPVALGKVTTRKNHGTYRHILLGQEVLLLVEQHLCLFGVSQEHLKQANNC